VCWGRNGSVNMTGYIRASRLGIEVRFSSRGSFSSSQTTPDRLWDPLSIQQVCGELFTWLFKKKRPGRESFTAADHSSTSSAELKLHPTPPHPICLHGVVNEHEVNFIIILDGCKTCALTPRAAHTWEEAADENKWTREWKWDKNKRRTKNITMRRNFIIL
jgi:hypothetical protein